MNWEVPLLLAFIIIFNGLIFTSSTDNFSIDSNGLKHYTVIPETTTFDDTLDNITNFLFLKYEDPWAQPTNLIIILVNTLALLYVGLMTTQALFRTNRLRINHNFLNKNCGLTSQQNTLSRFNFLKVIKNVSFFKQKKLVLKFSVIFIFVVFLSPFYFAPTFAVNVPAIHGNTINLDAFVSCSQGSGSSCTTGNITPDEDAIVIIAVAIIRENGAALRDVSTITFSTQSIGSGILSEGTFDGAVPDTRIRIFEIASPVEATAGVVVTLDGSDNDLAVGVYVISGAQEGSFIGASTQSADANPSDTITPTDFHSLVIGVTASDGAPTSFTGTEGSNLDFEVAPTSPGSLAGFSSAETGADLVAETRSFTRSAGTTAESVTLAFEIQGGIVLETEFLDDEFDDFATVGVPGLSTPDVDDFTDLGIAPINDQPVVSSTAVATRLISVTSTPDIDDFTDLGIAPINDQPVVAEKTALGIAPINDRPVVSSTATASKQNPVSSIPVFTDRLLVGLLAKSTPVFTDSAGIIKAEQQFIDPATDTVIVTAAAPTISITPAGAALDTITVDAGVALEIAFTDGNANAAVTTPADDLTIVTQDATAVTIVIPGTTAIAGGGWDETLEAKPLTAAAITSLLGGLQVDFVFSLGDTTTDLTLDKNIIITLAGQAGKRAFFETFGPPAVSTEIVNVCGNSNPVVPGDLVAPDCKVDVGNNLVIITNHLTDLYLASEASVTSGGGGGDGDQQDPSISIGFALDEFPIILDGVKYKDYQLDDAHTTIAEIGKQVSFTVMVYENSGPNSVQHVEMYVNHFGSRIMNVLTETSIIYDGQPEIEIIDKNGIISSADIAISQPNNKAVFTFAIVFAQEFPESDIMFRIWDISRNSMDIHIPNALMVVSSQQVSVGEIIEEPEPEVAQAEPIVPEAVPGVPKVPTAPTIPEVPEPEVVTATKMGWHDSEISVLKKWGGFDVDAASDIEVLAEFGVKGEIIPSYFKQTVKWVIQDQISQQDFVNALQFFKSKGLLSGEIQKQSFVVETTNGIQSIVLDEDSFDDNIKFDFGEENTLYTKANFETIQDKVTTIMALANNEQIRNELLKSNEEFASATDSKTLIDQREVEWLRNPKTITPFMDSLMNNEAALIAKALIEHDKEHIIPIESITITNAYGVNAIITEKTLDYKQSDEKWWGKAKKLGEYLMTGSGSEGSGGSQYKGEIILAINDGEGNFIGIIKAVVNLDKVLLS